VLSSAFLLDLGANTVQPLSLHMTPAYLDDGTTTTLFQDMFYSSVPRDGLNSTLERNNNLFLLGKSDASGNRDAERTYWALQSHNDMECN
jgi:hypothetical protein